MDRCWRSRHDGDPHLGQLGRPNSVSAMGVRRNLVDGVRVSGTVLPRPAHRATLHRGI